MADIEVAEVERAVAGATRPPSFAGFSQRLGALLVDVVVLALVGFLVGMVFGDALARMGGYERLVGFAIALAYGLLNSRLTGGRTLGKYLLRIRVADLAGNPISVPRALVRQVAFSVPFFLNGAPIDLPLLTSWLGVVLSLLVFGGVFAIVYLFVFNRKSRRSLHDLVAGTCVLRGPPATDGPAPPPAPVWRGHLLVLGVVALLSATAPYWSEKLAQLETFSEMMPVYQALNEQPGVVTAHVIKSNHLDGAPVFGGYITATLVLDKPGVVDEERAREIGQLVLEKYPDARCHQVILVRFVYGYDMVIASSHTSRTYRFAPAALEDSRPALR